VNLADVLDEIWGVLEDIPGLNVPDDGPGIDAGPPSPYLELPEVVYGAAGPGLDRIEDLGLTVVFGPANNTLVFRAALEAASTTGPRSIQAALMAHAWSSVHTLYVKSAEPTTVNPRGANTQLAYVFHLDITGAP
jgi:hypothetical protein